MRDKGKVVVEFDYLGRSYSYDLMEESYISDTIDQDRRDVIADIGFISAVLIEFVKRKNTYIRNIEIFCRDEANLAKVRDKISRMTGKTTDKISQASIDSNFGMFPQYTVLKDELVKIENKIAEIENFKWTLIAKKEMLTVLRQ